MKKITLLLTIICINALNGMMPEKPTYTYEETYVSLPQELKQEIISTALATGNDLSDAIKAIKALSALHGINYNNTDLVNLLMKKFPAIVKNVIIFALAQPEIYQKIDTILEKHKEIRQAIASIDENFKLNNLKDFTVLVHMLANRFNIKNMETVVNLFTYVTPFAKKYIQLGDALLRTSNSIEAAKLIDEGADINYSNKIIRSTQNYYTPLSIAAMAGNIDLVTFLLNEGANPHLTMPGTGTALDAVAQVLEQLKQYPNSTREEKIKIIKIMLESAVTPKVLWRDY